MDIVQGGVVVGRVSMQCCCIRWTEATAWCEGYDNVQSCAVMLLYFQVMSSSFFGNGIEPRILYLSCVHVAYAEMTCSPPPSSSRRNDFHVATGVNYGVASCSSWSKSF